MPQRFEHNVEIESRKPTRLRKEAMWRYLVTKKTFVFPRALPWLWIHERFPVQIITRALLLEADAMDARKW